MIFPSRAMTQPTRGLGVVVKRPRSASASARRIIAWSSALKSGFDDITFPSRAMIRPHRPEQGFEIARELRAVEQRASRPIRGEPRPDLPQASRAGPDP